MNDQLTFALRLPSALIPDIERTSSGRDLEEALDAWLADEFDNDDYRHVHSWHDDEEMDR